MSILNYLFWVKIPFHDFLNPYLISKYQIFVEENDLRVKMSKSNYIWNFFFDASIFPSLLIKYFYKIIHHFSTLWH